MTNRVRAIQQLDLRLLFRFLALCHYLDRMLSGRFDDRRNLPDTGSHASGIKNTTSRSTRTNYQPVCLNYLPRLARAVSRTGDGWLYLLIMPLAIYQLKPDHLRELVTLGLLGFGLERVAYFILKNVFRRQRPEEYLSHFQALISPSDRFSMPSGHTSAACFAATFLTLAVSPVFAFLYLYAFCVGLSRMVLGVHFPSDLVGGAALGITMAALIV